jgi:hypothetical protein
VALVVLSFFRNEAAAAALADTVRAPAALHPLARACRALRPAVMLCCPECAGAARCGCSRVPVASERSFPVLPELGAT